MHITSRIYDTAGAERLIDAARHLGFFAEIYPIRREDGTVIAVAFLSKDLNGIDDEIEMPEIAEKLSGLVDHDIEIVSAWDHPRRRARLRQVDVFVPGRGAAIPGEVIGQARELPASNDPAPR
jgi:hypothetical protein